MTPHRVEFRPQVLQRTRTFEIARSLLSLCTCILLDLHDDPYSTIQRLLVSPSSSGAFELNPLSSLAFSQRPRRKNSSERSSNRWQAIIRPKVLELSFILSSWPSWGKRCHPQLLLLSRRLSCERFASTRRAANVRDRSHLTMRGLVVRPNIFSFNERRQGRRVAHAQVVGIVSPGIIVLSHDCCRCSSACSE